MLLVEEQTSPYKLELAVYAPDAVGTAVGLMVRRPKLGQRAMVKDARERSEDHMGTGTPSKTRLN